MDGLARLRGLFARDGVITAGNSCGLNDAGAAVVLSREPGPAPLGRLLSWAAVGVPPIDMALGPVAASRLALEHAGLTLDQVDVIELNDSFTVQSIAVQRALGLDPAKVNPNGGAIALGHPMGATGTRVVLAALMELQRRGGGVGLCTVCVGGGQGVAAVVSTS
jgi:acetyl-CoA C-acetyltransferase